MYIINGIAYAGERIPLIRVKSVRSLGEYKLWVRFTTNEVKIFDFAPLLDFPCYLPLKDKRVFDSVYVDFGVAVWNDGDIDIAPERLYAEGVVVENTANATIQDKYSNPENDMKHQSVSL
jgi:hypothetical protein